VLQCCVVSSGRSGLPSASCVAGECILRTLCRLIVLALAAPALPALEFCFWTCARLEHLHLLLLVVVVFVTAVICSNMTDVR
jgi:hypothetical protein